MGLFGLFWSSIQAASLEHDAVRKADWTPQVRCVFQKPPSLRAQRYCMPHNARIEVVRMHQSQKLHDNTCGVR